MNRSLIAVFGLILTLCSYASADCVEVSADKDIQRLSQQYFRYSEIDGKPSLKPIPEPPRNFREHADPALCRNFRLVQPDIAAPIPRSSLLLALLRCMDGLDFQYEVIVAIFDRKDLNKPVCFSSLDLMTGPAEDQYLYGTIRTLSARIAKDGCVNMVITMGGADHPETWTSFALLRADMSCRVTVLSKLQAGYECDPRCEGAKMEFRFLNSDSIEVTTNEFVSDDDDAPDKITNSSVKTYSFTKLYKDPNARTYATPAEKAWHEQKALMEAAALGDLETIDTLVGAGVDLDARDEEGGTAVMAAIEEERPRAVKMLLDDGAKVNSADLEGRTALMVAAKKGSANMLKLLVQRGADIDMKDKKGRTALSIARDKGYKGIEKFLRSTKRKR